MTVAIQLRLGRTISRSDLVDAARTESEMSGETPISKVYCKNIYGIQYNPETKYWVPFRHGEVDLVKFTED